MSIVDETESFFHDLFGNRYGSTGDLDSAIDKLDQAQTDLETYIENNKSNDSNYNFNTNICSSNFDI